jgi:hemerythrin-like metal-binding protein
MNRYEWSDEFLLGIKIVDEHHEYLVDLLKRSWDLYEHGAPYAKLADILDELFEYTRYHFAAEEDWLREHTYVKLDDHLAEHEQFRQKIAAFQQEFLAGKALPQIQLFTFLGDWLVNHILVTDREYVRCLTDKK